MPSHGVLLSSAVAVGIVAGALSGRRVGWGKHGGGAVRLNGNERLLSHQEKRLVAALVDTGHGHLFQNWPPPGVRDEEKRALLSAVKSHFAGVAGALEPARLATLVPPVARKEAKVLEEHGDTRIDHYYWLRDDERSRPDVLAHLAAENAYVRAALADTEALQATLYSEMRSRIQEADESVPQRRHGFMYYTRTLEGQQYYAHCRRRVPAGAGAPSETDVMDVGLPEEVLLDENQRKESGRHTFYSVGDVETSPDERLLAWSEDTVGDERYVLHIKDLGTGKEVMPPIANTSGSLVWAADSATFFYSVLDHLDRAFQVYRYTIGSSTGGGVLVFEEKDESFFVHLSKSRSEEMLFIHTGSAITNETRYLPASTPNTEFQLILPRTQDVEYGVDHRGQHFYITMRTAGKPNSELLVAPVSTPYSLTVLLHHDPAVKIEDVLLGRDHLVVFQRSKALQHAVVHGLPADLQAPTQPLGAGKTVEFDEPAYSLDPGAQGDFDSPVLRLSYTSLTTPRSTIDHHMGSGRRAVKKVQPVLGGFRKEDYVTQRLFAASKDGTVQIPISIVYRKDVAKLDGTDPLLLNGYGSYEVCSDPYFSASRLCLLDRGFVFAIAHVRGGGEQGRSWYEDGKFLKKKNTFEDFIACAEHLVSHKYSSPTRLCIEGASAGGLLMGAMITMRPELFAAVVLKVPFVDVLTTMLDDTIPLTTMEWEEWGCPKDKEFYDAIKSYSPVDNVRPAHLPHILATASLHDKRVGYWEPAKFVAKLRDAKLGDNLLLFKCEMGSGHFSVTGRFERLKESAIDYAFLLKVCGMMGVPPATAGNA